MTSSAVKEMELVQKVHQSKVSLVKHFMVAVEAEDEQKLLAYDITGVKLSLSLRSPQHKTDLL